MATETDRFRSTLRKEQNRNAGGTRDRRKFFEDAGGGATSAPSTTSSSAGSRYSRATHDNAPSGRTTTNMTSKITKLSVNDDSKDDDDDEREERKEEEEQPTSRRQPKKFGGASGSASISNRIKKSYADDCDDDDAGDDSEERKEEEEKSAPRKQVKKPRDANANSGQKRKQRKNLREKRRSTGVVIMPGQPVAPDDEEERQVVENTARNMGESQVDGAGASAVSDSVSTEAEANRYIQDVEALKDELAKAQKEMEKLRNDNMRLKDENSALLRVVGSLSGTGGR